MGKNFIRHDINSTILKLIFSMGLCLCMLAVLPQAAFAEEAPPSGEESDGSQTETQLTTPQTAAEEAAVLWTQMEKEKETGQELESTPQEGDNTDQSNSTHEEQYKAALEKLCEEEKIALQGQLGDGETTWIAIYQDENSNILIGDTTSSALTGGNYYYLNSDITTGTPISVSGDVRLNLNGKTLTNTSGDVIVLNSNANLYLTDVTALGKENSGSIVAENGYAISGDSSAYVHLNCDSSISGSMSYTISDVYVTNSAETMAYRQISTTAIDVMGYYNGQWIQTTYSNNGYAVEQSGLDNATVTVSAAFVNGGQYIQLNYKLTAGAADITDGKLAVHADVQIGDNDYATVQVVKEDGKAVALKMVDTHDSCTTSKNAQFNLRFDGSSSVTPVSAYWFGYYSNRQANKFNQISSSTYSSGDSGLALSWQNIALEAGAEKTFSFALGVGTMSDPPLWGSSENSAQNKEKLLSVSKGTADNSGKLVVSTTVQDKSGKQDSLYYSVNDGNEMLLLSGNVSDGSVTLTSTIDINTLNVGTNQLSFWVVNDLGALSSSVAKTVVVTENEDGTKTATVLEHSLVYSAEGNVITQKCANGCDHSATAAISGSDGTYDGNAHTAQITTSDNWQGQMPTINYGDNGNINAGEVTALATISGAVASTTYTINPKALTVTAQEVSKDYGDKDPAFYTIEGLADGDTALVLVSRKNSDGQLVNSARDIEKVGTYTISYSGVSLSDELRANYTLPTTVQDSTLTIDPSENLIEYDTVVDGINRHIWVNDKDEVAKYQDDGSPVTYYLGGYGTEYYFVYNNIEDFTPTLIEGDGSVFDNSSPMPFRSDDSICNFQKVLINGEELSPAYYEVTEGSIRVTLKSAYLSSLEPGKYTIHIISSNGDASGEFTIPAPQPFLDFDKTATPRTGDSSSMGLWIVMLSLSAIGSAAAICGLKKKEL